MCRVDRWRNSLGAGGNDPIVHWVVYDINPAVTRLGQAMPTEGKLEYYRSLGVTEVVLRVPVGDRDVILRSLDEHAAFLS